MYEEVMTMDEAEDVLYDHSLGIKREDMYVCIFIQDIVYKV